jgi:hypothetical protein
LLHAAATAAAAGTFAVLGLQLTLQLQSMLQTLRLVQLLTPPDAQLLVQLLTMRCLVAQPTH